LRRQSAEGRDGPDADQIQAPPLTETKCRLEMGRGLPLGRSARRHSTDVVNRTNRLRALPIHSVLCQNAFAGESGSGPCMRLLAAFANEHAPDRPPLQRSRDDEPANHPGTFIDWLCRAVDGWDVVVVRSARCGAHCHSYRLRRNSRPPLVLVVWQVVSVAFRIRSELSAHSESVDRQWVSRR
jgi:hypothetical protein